MDNVTIADLAEALRNVLQLAERDARELAELASDEDDEAAAAEAIADVVRAEALLIAYDSQRA